MLTLSDPVCVVCAYIGKEQSFVFRANRCIIGPLFRMGFEASSSTGLAQSNLYFFNACFILITDVPLQYKHIRQTGKTDLIKFLDDIYHSLQALLIWFLLVLNRPAFKILFFFFLTFCLL